MKKIKQKFQQILGAERTIKLSEVYHRVLANFYESKVKDSQGLTGEEPVEKPFIYISQAPRCGGTLLKRMFDGHPALNVVPGELNWQKNGYEWSELKACSKESFRLLYDRWIPHAMVNGIDVQTPFHFSRSVHAQRFQSSKGGETRKVLNAYLDSFFAAWVNYEGDQSQASHYLAFCPWNSASSEQIKNYFSIFPDGFRLHIIRSPHAWWASEKKYYQSGKSLVEYLHRAWLPSCRDGVARQEDDPDRYVLINYEQLCIDPEKTMRLLCERLGIAFDPCLLLPSVNAVPTRANSSHHKDKRGEIGVTQESLERWKQILDANEIEEINREVGDLYERAISKCLNT